MPRQAGTGKDTTILTPSKWAVPRDFVGLMREDLLGVIWDFQHGMVDSSTYATMTKWARFIKKQHRKKPRHTADCPKLQFWDAGEYEARCTCHYETVPMRDKGGK